jgi:hypothetical protein
VETEREETRMRKRYMYRASVTKPMPFQRGQEKQAAIRRAAIDRSRGSDQKVWRRLACPGSAEWEDTGLYKTPATAAKIQRDIDRAECADIRRALRNSR